MAAIAISVARRAEIWGLVGAAIAGALMVARGRCPHAPSRAVAGLAVGALAGAAGGLVDAVPDIANQDEPASWVDPVALAVTGALAGALLGRLWPRGHWSIGLALGAGAGLLAHAVMAAPASPAEAAVRVTLMVGVVLAGLAAVDLAGRLAAQGDQAGARLSRPRFP